MRHWVRGVLEDAFSSHKNMSKQTKDSLSRIIQLVEQCDVYQFRSPELEEIADNLSECADLTDLSQFMWQAATATGFQNFVICVLKQGNTGTFTTRVCTSFNDDWLTQYQNKRYQYIDPVLQRAMESNESFSFSELSSSSPLVQEFWDDAEKHKIGRKGICFPFCQSDGTRIGVSYCSRSSEQLVNQSAALNGSDLRFIAELAAECFSYLSCGAPIKDDILTIEELRFLYILSSHDNPEEALRVSVRFGTNKTLQASIRSKLKVESVFQAIVIATSRGWFDLVPFDTTEVKKPYPELSGAPFIARLGEAAEDLETQNK